MLIGCCCSQNSNTRLEPLVQPQRTASLDSINPRSVVPAIAHQPFEIEEDPQTAATRYFDRNGVRGIFEGLVRELYVTKPADPLAAMIEMIDAGRV
eukprot:m.123956 g.123956  ORF g.123956 m.123956 type:complete len:96 (-) comp9661_c0_seq10:193-480(-)